MQRAEPETILYASGSTIAPPLSSGSIVMLILGTLSFVFMGGCFCLGLMLMFVLVPQANATHSLDWNIGQRVLAGLLFFFVGFCAIGAIGFLGLLWRRVGRAF